MKKEIIRVLSTVLAVCMMFALCAITASAEDDVLTYKAGDNATLTYYKTEKKMVVSGTGEMYDFFPFPTWMFDVIHDLPESLVIENGITSIGEFCFPSLTKVKSVTFPDSVTKISDSAFFDCPGLESVTLSNNITYIGVGAFSSCPIKSITLPEKLEYLDDFAFDNLDEIIFPDNINGDIDFGSNTLITYTKTLSISPNNKSYTYENGILYNKDKSVLVASNRSNKEMEKLVIDSNVKTIEDRAFTHSAPKNIVLPEGVTTIEDYAFKNEAISSVTVPRSVKNLGLNIFPQKALTSKIIVYCYRNTPMHEYAEKNMLNYQLIDKIGDADDNDVVNINDLLTIKKHFVKIKININEYNADCNGDGNINLTDMLLIKKYLVGIKVSPWD